MLSRLRVRKLRVRVIKRLVRGHTAQKRFSGPLESCIESPACPSVWVGDLGGRGGSMSSDLSWVPSDRSSGHQSCSRLTSCPPPAWWLALTMSCPLRPWQTLESSLRSQERPFQLPCVEPGLCPTGQVPPCPLLVPLSLGVQRPWGPEEEAEDKRGIALCGISPRRIPVTSNPSCQVSPHPSLCPHLPHGV